MNRFGEDGVEVRKATYFTVVSVMGFYMSDEQAAAMVTPAPGTEVDASTLEKASKENRLVFSKRLAGDLFPFLRAEVYKLSGSLQGVQGIMLQPNPKMNLPD